MKRKGLFRPTIEDVIELSGIEMLHPGGLALTRRTAEAAGLRPGLRVLDVSSGRGTQAVYYGREYGVEVVGVDISQDMVEAATVASREAGLAGRVRFERADSQALPFRDGSFDVVINECAVGIPDDSQRVLDEMVRVAKPGGRIVIHESTWRARLSDLEKEEIAERYGTTPLEAGQWVEMLERAGAVGVTPELSPWSDPENFWKIRMNRDVRSRWLVLTPLERLRVVWRIASDYGLRGLVTALRNERAFYRAVVARKLGYGLYAARRPGIAEEGA